MEERCGRGYRDECWLGEAVFFQVPVSAVCLSGAWDEVGQKGEWRNGTSLRSHLSLSSPPSLLTFLCQQFHSSHKRDPLPLILASHKWCQVNKEQLKYSISSWEKMELWMPTCGTFLDNLTDRQWKHIMSHHTHMSCVFSDDKKEGRSLDNLLSVRRNRNVRSWHKKEEVERKMNKQQQRDVCRPYVRMI